LQKEFSYYKTQQLILGTGIAIWWLTEPHWLTKWQVGGTTQSRLKLFFYHIFLFQIEGSVELIGVVRATEKRQQFEPRNQGKNLSVWAYR
jgi:hypothetical protein